MSGTGHVPCGRVLDQGARRIELLGRQPDVRVAPEALREDAGGLDRRREVEVGDDRERANREAPAPTASRGVVLRVTGDLDDPEDRLPDGGVEDRELTRLHGRPLRGRVCADLLRPHLPCERTLAAAPDEQPPLRGRGPPAQIRSTTPAIAMPKPTHIEAIP